MYCQAALTEWEDQPLRCDLFNIKCHEGLLNRYQEAGLSLPQMERVIWQYADNVLALYRPYFKEFVFDEAPEALPDEVQLALRLKEQQHCREEGNDLKVLESVRKCLGICAFLEEAVGAFAKMVRDEIQERDREADQVQGELRQVIASLKKAARAQIAGGAYQSAKEILLQVQLCAPEDDEVRELLRKISEV